MSEFQNIKNNIKSYKQKYYLNQALKGLIWFLVIFGLYYLSISIFEYYFWLTSSIRWILFGISILAVLFAIIRFFILPILILSNILKSMKDEDSANQIGLLFPEVKDKLLNLLQLQKNAQNNEWVLASVNQKAKSIEHISFKQGISIKKNNLKGFRWLFGVLGITCLVLFFYPYLITDSATRIWNPDKKYKPKAPFEFQLMTKSLHVLQNDVFEIKVKLVGNQIPEELSLVYNNEIFSMKNLGHEIFSFKIPSVKANAQFYFKINKFESDIHRLIVAQKLDIQAFRVVLHYPSHLRKKDELINNLGDLSIPEGTTVQWSVDAPLAKKVVYKTGSVFQSFVQNGHQFSMSKQFTHDTTFGIILEHISINYKDTLSFKVKVLKDQMPTLKVERRMDSNTHKFVLFTGETSDDNGISSIRLYAKVLGSGVYKIINIPFDNKLLCNFQYLFKINDLKLAPGQTVQYFIKITDNDVVHGGKSVMSEVFEYKEPTEAELENKLNENQKALNNSISKGSSNSKQILDLMDQAKESLTKSSSFSFENKQSFLQMKEKSEALRKNMEELKNKIEEQKEWRGDLKNEQLKEKEKQLLNMAEEILQKQLREQIDKINELLNKLNNNSNNFQLVEQLQEKQEKLQNELERMQELSKRLEMQVKMDDMSKKVDSMAFQELKMSVEMNEKNQNDEKLEQERQNQNELQKQLDKALKEIQEKNQELKSPMELAKILNKNDEQKANINKSNQSRKNHKMKDAADQSEVAEKNLREMAKMLQDKANDDDEDELEQDIATIRRLLQNLMRMSFDQENLMILTNKTSISSPAFVQFAKKQQAIIVQSRMIEDSLKSLASKVPKLDEKIYEYLKKLKSNLKQCINDYQERDITSLARNQQEAMMQLNNLTLLFGDEMDNKKSKSNSKKKNNNKPSNSSCKSPGGKKNNSGSEQMKDIMQGQKQLGDGMKQLKDAMEKKNKMQGQNPDGQTLEQKEGMSRKELSEMIARLAKQQEELRKKISNLNVQLQNEGGKSKPELNDIAKQMNKNETDLINKNINEQLIRRQEEILSRMLKSEEALHEQEQDDKRQANAAKPIENTIPKDILPYLNRNNKSIEQLHYLSPSLTPYYKSMVEKYFQYLGK